MRALKTLKGTSEKTVKVAKTSDELEVAIINAIDQHLAKRNSPTMKKVGGFHPSYTNQCARYWYYLFNGVEVTTSFSPQTYRIFDNGHGVHDRLYSYLREIGILVAEEIPVTYEYPPIEGTADGIIDVDGHKLIELKSISNEGFHYRKLYKKPKDEHFRQAQIYMRCLDLPSGFVIYENKNNQEILPIYIERDDVFIDKLFKKYAKIYDAYTNQEIPDRPYKRSSANCSNCDLADMCWSGDESSNKVDDPF